MLIRQSLPPQFPDLNIIKLTERFFCIVDPEDLPWLVHYDWRLVKAHSGYYAARRVVRNGHAHYIWMHRQIMNTPPGMQCHHHNGNRLDNRKENLSNIEPALHAQLKMCYTT